MAVACIVGGLVTMDSFHFILVIYLSILKGYFADTMQEYCAGERFRASCPGNQVVVMGNAKYGRMKIGKCIDEDFGHLGCYADVLHNLDKVCSGTKSCELVVIEVNASSTTCPKHFMKYLEATFTCTEVLPFTCDGQVIPLNNDAIISSETLKTCGSSGVLLKSKPGQRLNISAQYFDWDESSTGNCQRKYGTIRDSISSNSASICSGNRREGHVMVSNGNSVEIRSSNGVNDGRFLLHLKVLGCGDISAPIGGWVEREGDIISMGCHSGKHTWTLRCEGNSWQGVSGQCGTDIAMHVAEPESIEEELMGLSPGILVFAVCSVLIFLSAVIFTLGVCIHVKRSPLPGQEQTKQVLYEDQRHFLTMHPGNYGAQTGTMPLNINR